MYALPIVRREMGVAARRGDYFRIRYLAGGIMGLASFAAIFWCSYVWRWSTSPGLALFWFTSAIGVLAAFGAGLFLTVDTLSRERREGTLGLLFLTELRGLDIALGKFSAAASAALSGFLALIPILVLSLALGGVTGQQVWRMTLALLVLLFVSLALGLLISALVTHETLGSLGFIALMLAPSIVDGIVVTRTGASPELAVRLNPFYPAVAALEFDPGLGAPPWLARMATVSQSQFGTALGGNVALGFAAVLITGWLLPLQVRHGPGLRWLRFRRPASVGMLRPSRSRRSQHPVLWLSARDATSGIVMWVMVVGGLGLYYWEPLGKINASWDGLSYPLYLHAVIKWNLALAAGHLAAREKRSGLMETLITTPIETGTILRSHRLALRRYFLWPVIVAVVAHAAYIAKDRISGDHSASGWVAFASVALLYVDFFSLSWLGLWNGLRKPTGARAFLHTVLLGFIAPWLPFLLLLGITAFIVATPPGPVEPLLAAGFFSSAFFTALAGVFGMAQAHFRLRTIIATGR